MGMHFLSNVNAGAQKHIVIGMRIIVVVDLIFSTKSCCWVVVASTLVFCLGKTLISFITCRHSAAVWRAPQNRCLLLWFVLRSKSCVSVQCFMTSHGKTSYETVTFEIHHSKNRIKIDVLTSGCSYGSFLCGVIVIKVVKTLVKTVSELKGVLR